MKKIFLIILACGLLFAPLAFAGGDKNQGDNGIGDPEPVRDPAPFPWPGIDW